ncbi:MAG TPA: ATP-dependent endonuclease [Planktothrix sp.]|jgi:hypothetical protein
MTGSDGMWTFARRFLNFEEPSVKDSQLSKLHDNLPADQQQSIDVDAIGAIINARTADNILFSTAFALEDAQRFSAIAYAAWAHSQRANAHTNASANHQLQPAVQRVAAELGLSKEAADWCCNLASMDIPWHTLDESNLAQSQLVKRALNQIGHKRTSLPPTEEDLRQAHLALVHCVKQLRDVLPATILPSAILLVEGATEATLIPHIAAILGYSLPREGVMLVPAGGAKQVGKKFLQLRDVVSVPLFCLLDADAAEQAELIADSLRTGDQLHVLADGEIEDTLSDQLFARVMNKLMQANLVSGAPVEISEFARQPGRKRTAAAQTLLRKRASIDFDKVEFARLAKDYLRAREDVPQELRVIIDAIMQSLQHKRR